VTPGKLKLVWNGKSVVATIDPDGWTCPDAPDFAEVLEGIAPVGGGEAGHPVVRAFAEAMDDLKAFEPEMVQEPIPGQYPSAEAPEEIPVEASYCVFIRDTALPFQVEDSLTDSRVENHPKRCEIQAYYGVPLKDEYGITFGTLCHFDVRPVSITDANVRQMEEFAKIVNEVGQRRN